MTHDTTIHCDLSGIESPAKRNKDGSPRLPRGWKRHNGLVASPAAWKEHYVMRAVSIPLQDVADAEWRDFARAIHGCWKETTRLSNFLVTRTFAIDMIESPEVDGRLQAMPHIYLYPETAAIAPSLSGSTRSTICQHVDRCYRAERFAVRASCSQSLRSYRYPQPLPIRDGAWALQWIESKRRLPTPLIQARFADTRWSMHLRNDAGSARAITMLRLPNVIPTAIAIEARKKGSHKGLPTLNIRDNGGGNVPHYVSVRIACWVPREHTAATGTLFVRTDESSLLIAVNIKDERLWNYHADHLVRWTNARDRRKQRLSDDRKYEQRQPIASFQSRSDAEVKRYRRKMASACHEIAAQLVSYARRRRFATIEYNDDCQDFIPHFPWYELRSNIVNKCEQQGITFSTGGARKPEEGPNDE